MNWDTATDIQKFCIDGMKSLGYVTIEDEENLRSEKVSLLKNADIGQFLLGGNRESGEIA